MLFGIIVIPELWAIVMSFLNYKPGEDIYWVGLDNFRYILKDEFFLASIWKTFKFVFFSVILQIFFGLSFALLISNKFKLKKLWIEIILTPMAMSPAILGTTWKYLFNTDYGPINYILYKVNIEDIYWFVDPDITLLSLLIVYTWNHIPGVFILLYPAIITIPKEYLESSKIDGANRWQNLIYIILPCIKGALIITILYRTIISLRTFGEIIVLTKGGPLRATEVMSIYLYKEGFVYFNWGNSASVGVIILLVTLFATFPQVKLFIRQLNNK